MSNYDVTVDGVNLRTAYGLSLIDDTDLGEPTPKTYTVDIPGGDGSIDVTEALTRHAAYKTYTQKLVFFALTADVNQLRHKLMNSLHGRRLSYQLASDPGYTYTGRFSVSVDRKGEIGAKVTLKVTCDPYKLKEHCAYRLNATGGRLYRFESGRRPVHPTIECESVCFVTWEGETITVPAGTYRLNDVVFRDGFNELYVNSCKLFTEHWADVAEGGADAMTWADGAGSIWDDLQRLGLADDADIPQSWGEIALDTWASHADGGTAPKTWRDLDYRRTEAAQGSATVYLTYDWEDL